LVLSRSLWIRSRNLGSRFRNLGSRSQNLGSRSRNLGSRSQIPAFDLADGPCMNSQLRVVWSKICAVRSKNMCGFVQHICVRGCIFAAGVWLTCVTIAKTRFTIARAAKRVSKSQNPKRASLTSQPGSQGSGFGVYSMGPKRFWVWG
jgi:hypothetical protein